MHRWSSKVRAAAKRPPICPRFSVGTFRYADAYVGQEPEIDELREYDVKGDPRIEFPEGMPFGPIVDKYASWIKQGSEPIPVRAVEKESGIVSVRDGHHRRAAIRHAGHRRIKAWVSLTHTYPRTRHDGSTVYFPEGVTHEQAKHLIAEVATWRRAQRALGRGT